jgi:hypothetical protein
VADQPATANSETGLEVKIRSKRRLQQIALDMGTVGPAAFAGDLVAAKSFFRMMCEQSIVLRMGLHPKTLARLFRCQRPTTTHPMSYDAFFGPRGVFVRC